ncbi:MAG: tRNA pseudouridine(13) synthase TruD [Deltaproteobacteria bacterium]|nr:tRNA pseudouridine(13) synthase TruD [Deltaproteobacteria bacterium]
MNAEKTPTTLLLERLPYVTSKEVKISGKIRLAYDDFQVEEIESYAPAGRGEHLFVRFRKTGLTTPEAIKRIALALCINPEQASWAGLKDRDAVTEQWASFQGADPAKALDLKIDRISILKAVLHPHKLRTGHLRGNKFRIYLRETSKDSYEISRSILARLDQVGLANYYGEQRFGFQGNNLERAKRWVNDGASLPRGRFARKFYFSVIQSALFNHWLAHRLQIAPIDCPIEGDLLRKEDTGGMFTTDDMESARLRVQNWEVSPTGPIFGEKMRWPKGRARELEQATLNALGLSFDTLVRFKRYGAGSRRPARVRLREWNVSEEKDGLLLSFQLPKGAYATAVLRELLKSSQGVGNSSSADGDDSSF